MYCLITTTTYSSTAIVKTIQLVRRLERSTRSTGFITPTAALLVKIAFGVEVSVRRTVKLRCIGFERVGAELLDINHRRLCQTLRPQHVEARRRAIRIGQRIESVFCARLVAGDERRDGMDGGVGAGEIDDARFALMAQTLRGQPSRR